MTESTMAWDGCRALEPSGTLVPVVPQVSALVWDLGAEAWVHCFTTLREAEQATDADDTWRTDLASSVPLIHYIAIIEA
jgi:hypothetical protein